MSEKEALLLALKIDPDDWLAITDQIEAEARYRRQVMTHPYGREERAHLIRESKRRTQILTDCTNDWSMTP